MAQTLCKWKKDDLADNLLKFKKIVKKSKHVCKNCRRVAAKKKYLCEPMRLK